MKSMLEQNKAGPDDIILSGKLVALLERMIESNFLKDTADHETLLELPSLLKKMKDLLEDPSSLPEGALQRSKLHTHLQSFIPSCIAETVVGVKRDEVTRKGTVVNIFEEVKETIFEGLDMPDIVDKAVQEEIDRAERRVASDEAVTADAAYVYQALGLNIYDTEELLNKKLEATSEPELGLFDPKKGHMMHKNPITGTRFELRKTGRNRWLLETEPPLLAADEDGIGNTYDASPIRLQEYFSDVNKAARAFSAIAEEIKGLRRHHRSEMFKAMREKIEDSNNTPEEVVEWGSSLHDNHFGPIYEIVADAYNSSVRDPFQGNTVYNEYCIASQFNVHPSDVGVSDNKGQALIKRLNKKYGPNAVWDSWHLFKEIHQAYLRTLRSEGGVLEDAGLMESFDYKHAMLGLADGTIKRLNELNGIDFATQYLRIGPEHFYQMVVAVHDAVEDFKIRLKEGYYMQAGPKDHVWYEFSGSHTNVKKAYSQLRVRNHHVVENTTSTGYLLIQNEEKSWVDSFFSGLNLTVRWKGKNDEDCGIPEYTETKCSLDTKRMFVVKLNLHEKSCSACHRLDANAKQQEASAKAKEKLRIEHEQALEEPNVVKYTTEVVKSDVFAMSADPATGRNSQAADGSPRSSFPANPKTNKNGTRITTAQVNETRTKMENGAKVIETVKVEKAVATPEEAQLEALLEKKVNIQKDREEALVEWERKDSVFEEQEAQISNAIEILETEIKEANSVSDAVREAEEAAERAMAKARELKANDEAEREERLAKLRETIRAIN